MAQTIVHPAHPARTELANYNRRHPGIWQAVAAARARADWSRDVFLPNAVAAGILQARHPNIVHARTAFAKELLTLSMLASWRATQGIYRFDPDIYSEVCATPMDGEIPVDLLMRLPEWCVYIETPGMKYPLPGGLVEQLGAWVWLDCREGPPAPLALGFGMHLRQGVYFGQLALSQLTVEQTLTQMEHAMDPLRVLGWGPSAASQQKGRFYATLLKPVLPLVLYLCSEGADIGDGQRIPQRPEFKRSKGLERITPPSQPVQWDVGVRHGTALRRARAWVAAQAAEAEATGRRTVRPHFRSAHWAIRWIGPMNGERKAVVRWIPPTLVNARSPDELPAVIRPVRAKPEKDKTDAEVAPPQ